MKYGLITAGDCPLPPTKNSTRAQSSLPAMSESQDDNIRATDSSPLIPPVSDSASPKSEFPAAIEANLFSTTDNDITFNSSQHYPPVYQYTVSPSIPIRSIQSAL